MVQLTVKNGLSALAAVGFCIYGMILTSLGKYIGYFVAMRMILFDSD
jgi:hypothetical protein